MQDFVEFIEKGTKLKCKKPVLFRRNGTGQVFCDLSLTRRHFSDCCQFPDIYISQGSVATCSKRGGIFKHGLVANLPLSLNVIQFRKGTKLKSENVYS